MKGQELRIRGEAMTLKQKYEAAVNDYIKAFEKKQGYKLQYWVSDEIGSIADFGGSWFINFDEIRLDIDKEAPKGLIFNWLDETLESDSFINYKSYLMGLRYKDLKS